MSSIKKSFSIFGLLLIFSISTIFAGTLQNIPAVKKNADAGLTT